MPRAKPRWGLPRIVGALRTLGVNVAKSTVVMVCLSLKRQRMTITKLFIILCSSVCASLAISVGEARPANDPCAEAMTTVEMRECLNKRYNKVDGELNHVYQQVMSQLSKTRQTKLRETQRLWILFRDKSAEFEASEVEGGTIYPLVYLLSLASMTEKRVDELKAILQDMDSQ